MLVSRAGHRNLDAESGGAGRPSACRVRLDSRRYCAGPPSAASTIRIALISGPAIRVDTSPARSPWISNERPSPSVNWET